MTRKRFVKLLMAQGYSRNYINKRFKNVECYAKEYSLILKFCNLESATDRLCAAFYHAGCTTFTLSKALGTLANVAFM